ncbi:hypothetical protein J2W42_004716 [Rhizobium tibeticum]|nr:hypothetical protein [Rhizobium tibeticum]
MLSATPWTSADPVDEDCVPRIRRGEIWLREMQGELAGLAVIGTPTMRCSSALLLHQDFRVPAMVLQS